MNKIVSIIALIFFGLSAFAQNEIEMADTMRSNGKIYTVVAVCLTILLGLIVYVISLDRRISGIEKEKNIKQN